MISKVGTKLIIAALFINCCLSFQVSGQIAHAGRIVFERKTNLLKRFDDPRMRNFIDEDHKIKTENFELLFNDTCSVFKPIITDEEEDGMSWLTTKNTYYQFENSNTKMSLLSLIGKEVHIKGEITKRNWTMTDSKRTIGKYECRKAIYQKNDSTRIYAWYALDIAPSVGPEGFSGLPGAILGLATEDGGIIYFAKSVELIAPKKEVLTYTQGKNKSYSMQEFKEKIEKDFGTQPWGKNLFNDMFRWL